MDIKYRAGGYARHYSDTFRNVLAEENCRPRSRIGAASRRSFREVASPTLIRDRARDVPSLGRFWIDPASGAVLRSGKGAEGPEAPQE